MRAALETVLAQAKQGPETALFLTPNTLEEMLKEMQGMCQGLNGIKCTPRIAKAGFDIEPDAGPDSLLYYVDDGVLKAGYFVFTPAPDAPGL
jgi:hypothetical protein